MIRRYSFGKVFETESVPVIPPAQNGEIPFVRADELMNVIGVIGL